MPQVRLTQHLFSFFPSLKDENLVLDGNTVSELIRSLDERAPGIAFYICDERGRLRHHVNVFVDGELIEDRHRLSDKVGERTEVFISQALSGG